MLQVESMKPSEQEKNSEVKIWEAIAASEMGIRMRKEILAATSSGELKGEPLRERLVTFSKLELASLDLWDPEFDFSYTDRELYRICTFIQQNREGANDREKEKLALYALCLVYAGRPLFKEDEEQWRTVASNVWYLK